MPNRRVRASILITSTAARLLETKPPSTVLSDWRASNRSCCRLLSTTTRLPIHCHVVRSKSSLIPCTLLSRTRALATLSRGSLDHEDSDVTLTLNTTKNNNKQGGSMINVAGLADDIREHVRNYTRQHGPVRLVGILAQNGPFHEDARLYSDCIARTCQEDGIHYEVCTISGLHPAEVEAAIQHANQRHDVHGILVYYPIFKSRINTSSDKRRGPYKNQLTGVYYKTHDDYLRDLVSPAKDVEGLCHEYNARWLFRARGMHRNSLAEQSSLHGSGSGGGDVIFPCTALSVKSILEKYHLERSKSNWSSCVVTIVNRSEILGRPLAAMLALEGATVYSVDVDSILTFRERGRMSRCTDQNATLDWCLRQSSIVVTGVPSPDFIVPCEAIFPGTTLVNVSEFPNVCTDHLLSIPGLNYIPHVGKVTVASLEQNLIHLHQNQLNFH